MNNTINARVEFYFKGELFTPSATIELDQYMQRGGELPDLYLFLATENNIDSYSYHYEIMLQESIIFSDPKGLARDYCQNNSFDIKSFKEAWVKEKENGILQSIAQKVLDVDNLEQQPDLKQALLEAYNEGKKNNLTK